MDEEQEFENFIRDLFEREAEDDREWFAANPCRKYRLRALAPVESVDVRKSVPGFPLSTDSEPDADGNFVRSGGQAIVRREDLMLVPLIPPADRIAIRDNDASLAKLFDALTNKKLIIVNLP